MSEQLLIPEKAQNDVMVPIEPPALDSNLSALSEFCQATGLLEVTPNAVNQLRRAGVAMEALGTTNLTQPTTLATQQAVMGLLHKCIKRFDAPGIPIDAQTKLAHAVGYLAEKITRAGQAINETALVNSGPRHAAPKLRRSSFAPGEIVDVQSVPVPKPSTTG